MIDWKPYLESVCKDQEYTEWERVFVRLDAEGLSAGTELDLMVQAFREPEKSEHGKDFSPGKEVERHDALDGLRKLSGEHVLLRGQPGSGKTTTLRKLLLEEAEKAKLDPQSRIPVLISFRRFGKSTARLVRDVVQRHGTRLGARQLDSLMSQGRFFLLFDGINELPREETRLNLEAFRLKYRASTPMVFTTRDIGSGGDLDIRNKLEMAPLTPQQIETFVHVYVGGRDAAKRMLKSLRSRMRDFARTPLLLWMLCSVFKAKKGLPQRLGEAFRTFTRRYEREDKKHVPVSKESRRWWPKLLAKLAYRMMESGDQPTEIALVMARDEAEKVFNSYLKERGLDNSQIKAPQFLDDLIHHHLLREDAQAGIEFLHPIIQEYYAAEYLLTVLPGLPPAKIQRHYLNYLKWTEPIAMMLEFVDNEARALEFVRVALDVDPILGARLARRAKKEFQEKAVHLVVCWQERSVFNIWLLASMQSEAAVQPLLNALDDEEEDVRKVATHALGGTGSEAAIQPLIRMCKDEDEDVRRAAAYRLGSIGSEEAIGYLVKALEDIDEDVRSAAVFGLGWTDSEKAIQALISALDDKDGWVRGEAAKALGRIGGEKALEHLLKALAGKDEDLRIAAAYALGEIGAEEAIQPLIKVLSDEDEDVRSAAARALGRIGAEEAIQALINALDDKDGWVRSEAAKALGRIGAEEATQPLTTALDDKDEDVSSAAAKALGWIGGEENIGRIMIGIENGVIPTSSLLSPEREIAFGPSELPGLSKLAREKDPQILRIIVAVQRRCQYYNPALLPVDRKFCIVHLSDLHLGKLDRAGDLYVGLLLELKKDLELPSIEVLVISGDIVYQCSEKGYDHAKGFLSSIAKKFDLKAEKIFVVPGNHDMSRALSKAAYTVKRREDVPGPVDEHQHIGKNRSKHVEVRDEAKYRKRFAHFQHFCNETAVEDFPPEYSRQITWREYPDQKVLMVGLNSSWELDHHYTWRSGLHPDALNKAIEKAADRLYEDWLKIAVWHHPVMSKDAEATKTNKSWIRDNGFMDKLALAGFSMILHGHAHDGAVRRFPVDTGKKKSTLHVIAAGTLDAPEKELTSGSFWQHNIITITGSKVSVQCRKRVDRGGISRPDKTWLKGELHKSTYEFDLLDEPVYI